MRRTLSLLIANIFFATIPITVLSQTVNDIVSPSPSSSNYARYAAVPVDLHSGIPSINVPIYTIQSSKLSYPISLSYHALGNKVDDDAGMSGLGWVLGGGGIITRVVRGRPDELMHGFFEFAGSIPNSTDAIPFATKKNLADGVYDMLPDLFYFNTGTAAGTFLFDNQLTPRCIPRNDLKIAVSSTASLNTFTLTAIDGTLYTFVGTETMTFDASTTYISTWYLSTIVSADRTDTITFTYLPLGNPYTIGSSLAMVEFFVDAPGGSILSNSPAPINRVVNSNPITVTNTQYLTRIDYSSGRVEFYTGIVSSDIGTSAFAYTSMTCSKKNPLTTFFEPEKNFRFNYSFFHNTDNVTTRLRLDSFQEVDNSNNPLHPPYSFYYSSHKLPPPGSAACDAWGFYNGATGNANRLPRVLIAPETPVTSNDLSVHSAFSDACILGKIVNPLGGSVEYYFESNDYSNQNYAGPGLRINRIIKKDPFSAIQAVTNFDYKDPNTGASSGVVVDMPAFVSYTGVKEIINGLPNYYHCYIAPVKRTGLGSSSGSPVIYSYVTQYEGNDVNVSGKIVSNFSTYSPAAQFYPYLPAPDDFWQGGQLLSETVYSVTANVATPVKMIVNNYTVDNNFATIKGLKTDYTSVPINNPPILDSDLGSANYFSYSKFKYLSQSTVTTYEQNSNAIASAITQTFSYAHSDKYLLPTSITTSTSDPTVTLKKEFNYPLDYSHSGVLGAMQDLNMISVPIESRNVRTVSGTDYITGYQKTDFSAFTTYGIYPQNLYGSKIGTSGVLRSAFQSNPSSYCKLVQTFNAYDAKGFLTETQRVKGIPQAVVNDSFFSKPVATVNGANATQIAYTGFESSDYGNWSFQGGQNVQSTTGQVAGFSNDVAKPFTLTTTQSVGYIINYNRAQGGGPPVLTFSKTGSPDVVITMGTATGAVHATGNVNLSAGNWTAMLDWDTNNISNITCEIDYVISSTVTPYPVNRANGKTGAVCLVFENGHRISKTNLPPGDYVITYYEGGSPATFTLTGAATILTTATKTNSDGWTLQQKTVRITATTDAIQLAGTCYLDELRLYPVGAQMSTVSYDSKGRLITETDVNIRSQYYEYDTAGRLLLKRDHDRNVLTTYQYSNAGY